MKTLCRLAGYDLSRPAGGFARSRASHQPIPSQQDVPDGIGITPIPVATTNWGRDRREIRDQR